ncbi:MAG TPA: hypothetical protein DIT64_19900 [Verrucomicrobiales bacterium]|nr:hypothetical protein [Verrucomicrobiales bacterium]HCN76953.1 hypothetical protein [Verrucomicrobiales bacterium]HRJ10364.1 hypothetical protein [Prosthecobacter sp.]HRK15911.1 hypothetical protein [Prosthecobacter sp.]
MRTLSLLGLITAAALSCSCKSGERKPNLWPRFLGSGLTGSAPAQHLLEARRDSLIGQLTKQAERPSRTDSEMDGSGASPQLKQHASIFQIRYEQAQTDAAARNELVWDLIQIADVNYQLYEQGLVAKLQGGNAIINIGTAGMNAASTLSGSSAVKTTISTLTTFITGSQAEINKTIFRDMAIQTMISNMRALRAKRYQVILTKLRKHHNDAGKYPVGEAMKDVLDYYQAGTFVSAMIETQNSAAQVENEAKEATDKPAT